MAKVNKAKLKPIASAKGSSVANDSARERYAAEYAVLDKRRTFEFASSQPTVADVLAHASGTSEPDPLLALVDEIEMGIRMYRGTLASPETLVDTDPNEYLFMLERRARAAYELIRRRYAPGPNLVDVRVEHSEARS